MRIAPTWCLLLAVTLNLEGGVVRGAETNSVTRVGHLREFERFTFKGNTTFSAWSLWFGLNSTFDYPELSHPFAPRDAFLAAIGDELRLGYQHCGFPDARVGARYNAKNDRVVVRIQEGRRYRCGPVEVLGADKMPVAPIVEALTATNTGTAVFLQPFQFLDNAPANRATAADTGDSTPGSFLWSAGRPVHFDKISLRLLAGVVTNILHEHGFLQSRFSLNAVPDARTGLARLRVRLLEEGPQATVDHIQVVGNQRNSRAEILACLDLKTGMKFSSDLAATMNNRLYHSARFLTNWVSVGAPDASGRLALTVHVVENDECPPLDTAFEPTEETMLKARDWLANAGRTRENVVMLLSGYPDKSTAIKCILSPRRGLLVLEDERVSGTNRLVHALIASASQVALYAPERRQKFVAHQSVDQFQNWVTMETEPPDKHGKCVSLTVGASMQGLDDLTNAPPCAFRISLAPAAFVRLAHSSNTVCRFDGNQLIRSNANGVLKLDARSGRIIDFTANDEKRRSMQIRLRFQPDAYALALKQVEEDGAAFENVCNTNAPLLSAIAFFGSELAESRFVQPFLQKRLPAVTCAGIPALLRKLESGDLVLPFKSLMKSGTQPDNPAGKFQIPEERRPAAGGPIADRLASIARAIFQAGDKLLPVGAWPWTLTRDCAFLVRGQKKYLPEDLAQIYAAKDTGPLGCLVTAAFLSTMNSRAAKLMAVRGLERLDAADFRRDCGLFLDEKKLCGRFAAGLAATLSELNAQELDALVAPLPAASANFIRECAHRLRAAKKGAPLIESLAPALDTWWAQGLKEKVSNELRQIAGQ